MTGPAEAGTRAGPDSRWRLTMASKNVPGGKGLVRRRLVLLASVAGLGGALMLGGPSPFNHMTTPAFSQTQTAHPSGPSSFADVVEKVKSAVISVRVKLNNESDTTGSGDSMERFFRQFGMPRTPRHHFAMAQGSGFFISADGYAVTN